MVRLKQFWDSVAANIVSAAILAVGGLLIALFTATTHGLTRWEQAGSLGLFALVVLALAGMAFWNKKLRSGPTGKPDSQMSEEAQRFWCWAGVMLDQADRADALKAQLKSVWHLWNNSSKKLIYPLHSAACTALDSWEDRQLLEFRILYRHHLEDLTIGWKDFQSAITAAGFPNDAVTYAFLEEMLPPHAEQLRKQARHQIEAFLSSG